jgi:hypothetical protein
MKSWLRENWRPLLVLLIALLFVAANSPLWKQLRDDYGHPSKPSPVREEAKIEQYRVIPICPKGAICYFNMTMDDWNDLAAPAGYETITFPPDKKGHQRKICYGYTATWCDESYQK